MKESQTAPTVQGWNVIRLRARVYTPISRWLTRYWHHYLAGYVGAVLLSLVAIAATLLLLDLIPSFAYPGTFAILATLIIALLWGAGPSQLATILQAFLLDIVILPPHFAWSLSTLQHLLDTVIFLLIGFIISVVASRMQQARAEAVNAWLLHEYTEARANELAALEATQRMDTFLGIASHELRTPLTVIKGNLQLAKWKAQGKSYKQNDDADKAGNGIDSLAELLVHAEQQVNRLTRLVDDLTEVSRLHTNKIEMWMEACDLCAIVRKMVEEQRALAPTRIIHLELDSSCPLLVHADAVRIGQVVTNYLSNALKYSPNEQPVEVRIEQGERDVRVLVHDRGPGLTSQQQEQIWERFHRVEGINVQSGSSVGLGLGLYISRMIIEQHQGRVGVESTPGEGSTFWFTLPSLRIEEESAYEEK